VVQRLSAPDSQPDDGDDASPSRRSALLRGAAVISASSVFTRALSFAVQLLLGRILLESDFGLYALAIGVTEIAASLRSVLQPVLVEQLENDVAAYERLYRTMMASIVGFGLVVAASSSLISNALNEPDLRMLLVVLAFVMPFELRPVFGVARLNHDLSFPVVARVITLGATIRYGTLVVAALAGFGVYTFAAGAIAQAAVEYLTLRRHIQISPGLFSARAALDVVDATRRLVRRSAVRRWIWPSAVAYTLMNSGDYLAASPSLDNKTIGQYFFAFTLVGSFYGPISLAVNSVLVPGFVTVTESEDRRVRLLEVVRLSTVLGMLLFGALLVAIAPMVHVFWSGKWDAAVPAMIGFLIVAPIAVLQSVGLAIVRACGYWTLYFTTIVLTGVITVLGAGIGAAIGGLIGLVVGVALTDTGMVLVTLARLARRFEAPMLATSGTAVLPWLLGLPALGAAHLVNPLTDPRIGPSLLAAIAFTGVVALTVVVPYRAVLVTTARLLLNRQTG
jgi:PST family polysaccharide transporter